MKALAYDLVMAPFGWMGLTAARRRLVEGLCGKVLEVGTGTGLALPGYPSSVHSVVAIDLDEASLARARGRRPGVTLLQADVQDLPFPDASFDAVVSSLVFCSVEHPLRGLEELFRVLRPGGELRMLEHVRAPGPVLARVQEAVDPLWCAVTGGCHLNRDTVTLVREAGFRLMHRAQRLRGVGEELVALRPPPG
jgi:ubiquinone/menaquinone biosynthesis C-methylase UbiE